MKFVHVLITIFLLSGCAGVSKVETGENKVGERLKVTLNGPWNKIQAPNLGPAELWSMEGITIDQLLIYSGLKDGEAVHSKGPKDEKSFIFHSRMEPGEVTSLFEGMLTRDGSIFKLTKLEPQSFGGSNGFHFEFSLIRKVDNVQLSGTGYGAVNKGELFALVYLAPRLTFFPRHKLTIEKMAASAAIN